MSEPIKSGDRCEVVWGLQGEKSPNIGLVVVVRSFVGEHSQLGRIWRCEAEYAELGHVGSKTTCPPGHADFAQSWLRKLPPPHAPRAANEDKLELRA